MNHGIVPSCFTSLTLAFLALAHSAAAQPPEVSYTATPAATALPPGENARALLSFKMDEEFHVNAHKPLEEFYIPTVVTVEAPEGIQVVDTIYPDHKLYQSGGEELAVYGPEFHVGLVLDIGADVPPGTYQLTGTLKYQACNDTMCFPPDSLPLEFSVDIGPAGEPVKPELFASISWPDSADGTTEDSPEMPAESESHEVAPTGDWKSLADQFDVVDMTGYENTDAFLAFLDRGLSGEAATGDTGAFAGKSWALILLLIVVGGFALNLTPCVLPLIPINVAIIGAGARAGSRGRGFALGGTYGTGIALVYGLLGLAVMLSVATAFGTINASPWFNLAIAVLFVVLGLAMFDVIQIDFTKFQNKLGLRKNENGSFAIAFIMGCVSALLAGACVAPVVISTILFAQDSYSQGNTFALALPFLLGVGMALPWPFVGAGLSVMPKPGMWMVRVKQAFGVFIIAFAIYYGYQAYTLMQVRTADVGVKDGWHTSLEEGLAEALAENKPVFLDFWATWCKNCLVMDKTTLVDPAVVDKLESFVKIKYQAEQPATSPTKEIWEYYDVIGMPAYLILQPKEN